MFVAHRSSSLSQQYNFKIHEAVQGMFVEKYLTGFFLILMPVWEVPVVLSRNFDQVLMNIQVYANDQIPHNLFPRNPATSKQHLKHLYAT